MMSRHVAAGVFVLFAGTTLGLGQHALSPAPIPAAEAPAARAQWVFLRDKGIAQGPDMDRALADLRHTYNPRAVQRRELRRTDPGLFDARDIPVSAAYRDAILATGVRLRVESRWLNAVSVLATEDQARALAALPFVDHLEPVRTGRSAGPVDFTPQAPGTYGSRENYGRSTDQITQMGANELHNRGFTGNGVIVGVLDTGFNRIHNVFNNPAHPVRILAERDFINNDLNTGIEPGDADGQHSHGTLILSCMGSYLPGEMIGASFDATFILCKTEDLPTETPVEEDYYAAAIEYCESLGADVTTSSLSYSDWYTQADMNGLTGVTSIALNTAAANGVHTCTAAGNAGNDEDPATSRLGAPADAFKVLTCGSVNGAGVTSSFSSDGPTADGRIKPELLARGRNTACVNPDSVNEFGTASGTSLSTPLLAGAVACLVQAHPDWTVDQMRTNLFATAGDQVANGGPDPLFVRGYGIVNVLAAHLLECSADFNRDGGVDGADVEAFFTVWEGGEAASDVNHDGGVDGSDVEAFFIQWSAGGC